MCIISSRITPVFIGNGPLERVAFLLLNKRNTKSYYSKIRVNRKIPLNVFIRTDIIESFFKEVFVVVKKQITIITTFVVNGELIIKDYDCIWTWLYMNRICRFRRLRWFQLQVNVPLFIDKNNLTSSSISNLKGMYGVKKEKKTINNIFDKRFF